MQATNETQTKRWLPEYGYMYEQITDLNW